MTVQLLSKEDVLENLKPGMILTVYWEGDKNTPPEFTTGVLLKELDDDEWMHVMWLDDDGKFHSIDCHAYINQVVKIEGIMQCKCAR